MRPPGLHTSAYACEARMSTAYSLQPFMDRAACKGRTTEMFPREGSTKEARQAQAICKDCPVLDDCLQWVAHPDRQELWIGAGVVAGLTRSGRRRTSSVTREAYAAGTPPTPPTPIGCGDAKGTYAGSRRHYRRGEPPCPECSEARSEYVRNRMEESVQV